MDWEEWEEWEGYRDEEVVAVNSAALWCHAWMSMLFHKDVVVDCLLDL